MMKVSVVVFMKVCPAVIFWIDALLSPWQDKPKDKLPIVMIAIPLIMNTFQLLVTDKFIKKRQQRKAEVLINPDVSDDPEVARESCSPGEKNSEAVTPTDADTVGEAREATATGAAA